MADARPAPDITLDRRGLCWLIVVATREAWRAGTTPERPAGTLIASDDELECEEPPGPASDPLELAIAHELHHQRIKQLSRAKPREATVLFLQAAGYSYTELMRLSRGVCVNVAKLGARTSTTCRR